MSESTSDRHERRYSLWQTALALAALAILVVMLAPDVSGLLRGGEKKAYDADLRLLTTAVDSWRSEKAGRQGAKPWPTLGGTAGTPDLPKVNTFIDIALLAEGHYLKGSDTIVSADVTRNSTATNSPSGSYGWFVDGEGVVSSMPPFEGKYP